MDLVPPKRSDRRPKVTDMEPSGADVEVVIDSPEAPVQGPEVDAPVERSGRATEVRSAANLERMESLVGGAIPADDASGSSSTRSILAPVLFSSSPPPSESSPLSSQPLSDRELVSEADKPEAKPPTTRRRPSFFDIGDDPASRSHLFNAEPAPFDSHVPSLPGRTGSDPKLDPDSGLLDIRRLAGLGSDPKKKKTKNRADEDIFRLTGGLFAASAAGPLIAPDLKALTAPVVPEGARSRESDRPSAALGASSTAPELAGATAPVGSAPAATATSRRSTRAAWAVGITALGAGLLVVALKLSKPDETATTATTMTTAPLVSASSPPSAMETAAPALPVITTPPIAPSDPDAPVKREKDPAVATPVTAAPRSTAPSSPGAPVTAPVVAAPIVTAPVVVAPPPPPPGGAEFNRSAAIAALSAAAGRAAGCKQPDDPAGGANVSITFAPSGRVTSSKVTTPPFQGTPTGGCIAAAFRAATVPPFEGAPVTVTKNVSIR